MTKLESRTQTIFGTSLIGKFGHSDFNKTSNLKKKVGLSDVGRKWT